MGVFSTTCSHSKQTDRQNEGNLYNTIKLLTPGMHMTTIYTLVEDYSGYESPFLAQHGVSFLIEHKQKTILFDVGQDAAPILYNMDKLGLDPQEIDYIFLSHCHYDHTGGLLDMLKAIGKKIPVIAHPLIFRSHVVVKPELKEIGVPFKRKTIETYGELLLIDNPTQIVKDIHSTGEIVREDFEKGILDVYTYEDGNLVKDEMRDDMSTVIATPEGLVIISGCSHAGIVSTVTCATKILGDKRIKAVIGGFHLIHSEKERIVRTVEAFKKLGVETVYTGHCTGLRAEAAFLEAYKEKFIKLHSGCVIEV